MRIITFDCENVFYHTYNSTHAGSLFVKFYLKVHLNVRQQASNGCSAVHTSGQAREIDRIEAELVVFDMLALISCHGEHNITNLNGAWRVVYCI